MFYVIHNPTSSLALTIDHVEIKSILLNMYKRLFCPQVDSIDLFSLYILFSHFRPRDALMGIFLLFFSLLMRTFARA